MRWRALRPPGLATPSLQSSYWSDRQHRHTGHRGHQLGRSCNRFVTTSVWKTLARQVAARSVEAGDKTSLTGSAAQRRGSGWSLSPPWLRAAPTARQRSPRPAAEPDRPLELAVDRLIVRQMILDRDILALDKARLVETLPERAQKHSTRFADRGREPRSLASSAAARALRAAMRPPRRR